MATVQDLITNRPKGLFNLSGVTLIERGTVRLQWRVMADGAPVDLSTCTVDVATINSTIDGGVLVPLDVKLGADGLVTITGELSLMTETLVPYSLYPNGRDVILSIRLKDPQTWPFYLVAPSRVTIAHAPGSNT